MLIESANLNFINLDARFIADILLKGDIKKVVLAYSGGLDTSIILKWLQTTYGCEVVTFTADLGQGGELAPAREKALRDQLGATESEHSVKIGALREAERMLQEKQAELAKLASDLHDRSTSADSQRVEVTALRAQVETLKDRVGGHEREAQEEEEEE